MPSSLPSPAGTAPHRSVLLIEEYDALAVAIASALKKFAPRHATDVARSLAEARVLAAKSAPDLFIIDFDPNYPDLTEFLREMQGVQADARALIIAAGVPREIAAERRSFGALQFIEKPFEVADFGAAVQALLGPWRESESAISRGTLRFLSLPDVVLLQCAGGRSVAVEVKGSAGRSGAVHILDGQISHAETEGRSGVDALKEMFTWSEARMSEAERPASAPRTIHGPWAIVFLDAWRRAKTSQQPSSLPSKETRPKTGKKIVVIDDTEMLLIFVEDVLATADPNLRITTALNGLRGIKEIERIIPDLVLLDYSLPDLTGDEVCRRLLQDERTARVPVLMMSGHVPEMAAAAACLENVVTTIAKPFLSDALVEVVERTLAAGPRPASSSRATVAPVAPTHAPAVAAREPKRPEESEDASESIQAIVFAPPTQPAESATAPPKVQAVCAPLVSGRQNDVVLGLFLEVVSMQFTPQLRMGAVRAKPFSFTVSLHMRSAALRAMLPLKTGFQLGQTELDANGRITTLRLSPTLKPFQPAPTRNAFEIGDVAVIPAQARDRVELIPAAAATMTMQLLAQLELVGVQLSPTFQVAQLILKWCSNAVRVTFSSNGITEEKSGAAFETAAIQPDNSARIAELLLNPVR
ncbi:MAG TPA: response regulator [Chthoniobacterales bacterium]|nr:response regulator [Chthoniobacterales bacterium]